MIRLFFLQKVVGCLHVEFSYNQGGELEIFLWGLGWVRWDELKVAFDNCTWFRYQFRWLLLIIHGKYWRLHECFDKVKQWPHILNNKKINSHSRYGCTRPQSIGKVGYVFRLNKPNKIVEHIQHHSVDTMHHFSYLEWTTFIWEWFGIKVVQISLSALVITHQC